MTWPKNLVWDPRVSAAEIAQGTGTDPNRQWAVVDVRSMVWTWAASAPGVMANPMTTWGDVIYGGQTPAGVPTRLGAGAAGTYLKSNGVGAAPAWAAVSGVDWINLAPNNQWGWFGPGTSATNVATLGVFAGAAPTATDAASVSGSAGSTVGGGQRFQQTTSAVANNTTVLSFGTVPADPTASIQLVAGRALPVYVYTFGLGFFATGYFAANFGADGAGAASATATEDNNSCGVSFLSGDATFYAFSRASGGGLTRTAMTAGPASNGVYTLVVDFRSWPTSVRVCLYNVATATWIGNVTLTTNLPSTSFRARIAIYRQTETAAVREVNHFSCGVINAAGPLSLP